MATDSTELTNFLSQNAPQGEFSPCAHYDSDADALTVYLINEPDYRKRLNSRVTIYLSIDSDQLVGCRIKGVRTVLEDIGWFDLSISHGRAKLTMLFAALHGKFADAEDARDFYRKLGEMLAAADIEVDVETADC